MKLRSPATSFVAALDEPFRFVRDRFADWAPATFALAAVGVVPGVAMQWFNAEMVPKPGEMPDFTNLLFFFVAMMAVFFLFGATMLGAFVVVGRVLDGRPVGAGEALAGGFSPRMLLVGGLPLLLVFMGFGCIVGGPVTGGLVGFAPVVALARPGQWFTTWNEAFTRALVRVSPRDAGLPAYKLGAIVLIWYGINSVTNQLALLPTAGWMIWNIASGIGSGDALGAMQTQPPFAVAASGVILGAVLRPFSDIYLAAGITLLWRDLDRVREGADLEALVDGRAA